LQRWLERTRLRALQPVHAHAIAEPALIQRGQRDPVVLVGRDDQLAGAPMSDAFARAELVQEVRTAHTAQRLERTRRVIHAGVDDAGVATGDALSGALIGFQHEHFAPACRQRARDRQADHARTDHHAVHIHRRRHHFSAAT